MRELRALEEAQKMAFEWGAPQPPIKPKVGLPTILHVMLGTKLEIPLNLLKCGPKLRPLSRGFHRKDIPIPEVFGFDEVHP
jgi:hypothetical protein